LNPFPRVTKGGGPGNTTASRSRCTTGGPKTTVARFEQSRQKKSEEEKEIA